MLIQTVYFFLFVFFFLYIPAKILLVRFGKISVGDQINDLSINLIFGTCFFILIMAVLSLLKLPLWTCWIFPLFSLWGIVKFGSSLFKFRISREFLTVLLLLVIIALIQAYPLFLGGTVTSEGIRFPSVHDNLWNISILKGLLVNFPPENPAVSGAVLKNHHYFYLFFLGIVHKTTGAGIYDLYFRLGPVFVSALFGLAVYSFSCLFTRNPLVKIFALIMGVFSGNFAYLAPFFIRSITDWKGNLFYADQPFDQIFNPYTVLGFAVFLGSIYSFANYEKGRNKNSAWLLVTAVLVSVSYGIKSFSGVILIISLSVAVLYDLVVHRRFKILKLFIVSILMFLPVFFLISGIGSVTLKFIPGWLLTEMMVGGDKLNLPVFVDRENFYMATSNIPGLLKIKTVEFLIYFVGNMGIRLIGLMYLLYLFFDSKSRKLRVILLFCLSAFAVSFSIPLVFNLSASPYNIIQFTPFSLLISAVFTSLFVERAVGRFKGRKKLFAGFFMGLIIFSLALPVNLKNILEKIGSTGDLIPKEEYDVLSGLGGSEKSGILLINPSQFKNSPIYVPAVSGFSVYLADPGYARQTGQNPEPKLRELDRFFEGGMKDIEFLRQNRVTRLYLLKNKEVFDMLKVEDLTEYYSVIRENNSVVLLAPK